MTVPVLMGAVQLTTTLFTGEPMAENLVWLQFMAGFDLIFTLLGLTLVETILVG